MRNEHVRFLNLAFCLEFVARFFEITRQVFKQTKEARGRGRGQKEVIFFEKRSRDVICICILEQNVVKFV